VADEVETHQSIAFIPHGGTINVILDHLTGGPFDDEMRYLLATCGVSTLDIGPVSVSVTNGNDVSHLPWELITPPGEHPRSTAPSR